MLLKLTKQCVCLINNRPIKQIDGYRIGVSIASNFYDIYVSKMQEDILSLI